MKHQMISNRCTLLLFSLCILFAPVRMSAQLKNGDIYLYKLVKSIDEKGKSKDLSKENQTRYYTFFLGAETKESFLVVTDSRKTPLIDYGKSILERNATLKYKLHLTDDPWIPYYFYEKEESNADHDKYMLDRSLTSYPGVEIRVAKDRSVINECLRENKRNDKIVTYVWERIDSPALKR